MADKQYATEDEIFEHFPIGSRVRFENEAFPGHWEYGTVESHSQRGQYGAGLRIKDAEGYPVEFDYRYLDTNPHNSLVRLVK